MTLIDTSRQDRRLIEMLVPSQNMSKFWDIVGQLGGHVDGMVEYGGREMRAIWSIHVIAKSGLVEEFLELYEERVPVIRRGV